MTNEEIIKAIEEMSVGDLAKLVKALEEKFGVSAAAPVAVAAVAAAPAADSKGAAKAEEKTSFNVLLKEAGDKKLQVIKVVREITNLGLKEAKDLVDKAGAPDAIIKQNATKEEADQIKAKLEEAGAVVELK
ncbi:50S ribosomal protein L7/L12 [Athalassotoga saccharophila]|uniref:50S ribosomal protein L7/L12 n=1 Tax=Athalassotoga saccharophila TaxID=1441386 RepID=UPI00137A1012|nr:50S ribosomal protein L7/L12 [Athalassotoga saccharophila]BBJ27718.1 50S ribosomal protein L7/L12 [Athalassotoga saccharophila]